MSERTACLVAALFACLIQLNSHMMRKSGLLPQELTTWAFWIWQRTRCSVCDKVILSVINWPSNVVHATSIHPLLGAPGLTTRSKDATNGASGLPSIHQYGLAKDSLRRMAGMLDTAKAGSRRGDPRRGSETPFFSFILFVPGLLSEFCHLFPSLYISLGTLHLFSFSLYLLMVTAANTALKSNGDNCCFVQLVRPVDEQYY